jgi:putative sterol carrier protein
MEAVMASRRPVPWAETAKQFEDIPVLADFIHPFPNLLGEGESAIGESFKRIAAALSKSKRTGAIQFTINEGGKTRQWCVGISPNGCEVTEMAIERPNLDIVTDAGTWADIASGRVAPLEAFGIGKVRVRGDIELAQLLARRLQR